MTVPTDLMSLPQVRLIAGLFELVARFLPSSDRTLTGTLHLHGKDVIGASFNLETRSKVLDGDAVWSGAYGLAPGTATTPDRSDALYPLAFPVAVWSFWQVATQPERLGTRSWRSYALFGMGSDHDAAGETEKAEQCYLRALGFDPDNTPARLNLASMWLMSAPVQSRPAEAALDGTSPTLDGASAVLDGASRTGWARSELTAIRGASSGARLLPSPYGGGGPRGPDAFWFRAQYVLAADAAHRQLHAWQDPSAGEELERVGRLAVELATDLATSVEEALGQDVAADDQAYRSFLEDVETPALIMWAGARLVRDDGRAGDAAVVDELEALSGPELHRRLAALLASGSMSPAAAVVVCERHLRMPPRARYNLACYRGVAALAARRRGRDVCADLEAAFLQLRLAAPGLSRSMRQMAAQDACLVELRRDPHRALFDQVVDP